MNKKLITLGLTLMVCLGVVGCGEEKMKEDTTQGTPQVEKDLDYRDFYMNSYDNYLSGLTDITMFGNNPGAMEESKNGEYPGNEKYLYEVKAAYKESRDNIDKFVTTLKEDAKTDDEEFKKFNEELIAEGEKLIKSLDNKIEKLEGVTEEEFKRSDEDFQNYINEFNNFESDEENKFEQMIKDMNKKLEINKK